MTPGIAALRQEAEESGAIADPYRAFNAWWLVLIKAANLQRRVAEEHEQVVSLLRRFTRAEASVVLAVVGVDALLGLDPPIETILSAGERAQAVRAKQELARLRARRATDPKAALLATFEILQRIRDKREHGFKSLRGPRDREILGAAVSILQPLVETALETLAHEPSAQSAEPGEQNGS